MNSKLNLLGVLLLTTLCWKGYSQESDVRPFQLSFLPNIGTQFSPLQHYTNHVSLNMIGGLNEGVEGAELGGIFNIDQKHVVGAQLGGIFNLVGGNVSGAQLGGIYNGTRGYVKGAQLAGISNNAIHATGLQAAGISNVNMGNTTGLQAGGISNFTGKEFNGLQVGGIANYAKKTKGAQIGGIFNHTSTLKGVQISGLINQAGSVKGLQLGIINIADTVERGVTFGLLNIVRTGLHQFEVSTNDVTDFNLSFRSGTNAFYSILTAGIQGKNDGLWGYGAGFGSRVIKTEKWYGNVEATSNTIQNTKKFTDKLSMDNRLALTAGYSIMKHLSISGGPVVHVYVSQPFSDSSADYGLPITDHSFFNKTGSSTNVKMWVGYQVGVRF